MIVLFELKKIEILTLTTLYCRSLQQRLPPGPGLDSPLPSLHPNFQISKQKHVGGGGLIVQTRHLPPARQGKVTTY